MTDPHTFSGFDQARHALWCYEARSRTHRAVESTSFIDLSTAVYIHVDTLSRLDRSVLTAFDGDGYVIAADTVYLDDGVRLESIIDFDAAVTGLAVAADSPLAKRAIDGWVIDMAALRMYDLLADRRSTQKEMALALLRDMVIDGDARALVFGDTLSGPKSSTRKR